MKDLPNPAYGEAELLAQAEVAIHRIAASPREAEGLAQTCLAAALAAGAEQAARRARYALAAAHLALGDYEQAANIAAQGRKLAEEEGSVAPPELLNIEGSAHRYLGRYALSVTRLLEAAELAEAASGEGADSLRYPIHNNLGLVLLEIGEAERAYELLIMAEREAEAAYAPQAAATVRANRGRVLVELGRAREALELLADADAAPTPKCRAAMLLHRGHAHDALCEYSAAEAAYRAALVSAEAPGFASLAAEIRARLARTLLAQGRYAEAEAEARHAEDETRGRGYAALLAEALETRGRAFEALCRFREAAEAYRESIELAAVEAKAAGRAAFSASALSQTHSAPSCSAAGCAPRP